MKRHICDTFIRRSTPVLHSLCQKLGILKIGPKHHPPYVWYRQRYDPIILYYRLLFDDYASVYFFINRIILEEKIQNCYIAYLLESLIHVLVFMTMCKYVSYVVFYVCLFRFVNVQYLMSCLFLCSLLSFLNSDRNLDSVFTNISKIFFFIIKRIFLKREHRLKW